MSIETAAREARYAFLRRAAAQCRADRIATAHNLNDNAETVLFRMARGTGLRGLTGIPVQRDLFVRPLLGVSRGEILAYLDERGIPHREDATNALDVGERNYIRHHILPAMEHLRPGAAGNIARMTETLAEDEAYLTSQAEAWLSAQDPERLPAAALAALPKSVARRVLRLWLGENLSRERTEAVLRLCAAGDPSGRVELPGRCVRREYDALLRTPPPACRPLPARELRCGERLSLPEAGLTAECRELTDEDEIQSSFNIFCFSCDNICGKLCIASRAEGDTIALRERGVTKSVTKLMIERRIPRRERETIPVIRDEKGVLAVYGFGQSQRAFPVPGQRFYKITFEQLEDKEI